MVVEERFAHEAHPTHKALIRLLVTVHKAMSIAVISAIKCFPTNLKCMEILIYNI